MFEDDSNLMNRIHARIPVSKSADYNEDPAQICCTEVFRPQKKKICDRLTSRSQFKPERRCLSKVIPCPISYTIIPRISERETLYRPIRWRCKAPMKETEKSFKLNQTLGSPIGLSKSSFSMSILEEDSRDLTLLGFATSLIAFAEYFITPEIEWDEHVLNRILLEGQRLFAESRIEVPEGQELSESMIKRNFKLCENYFDLIVNEAFIIGSVIGEELPVPNLYSALLKFFKKFQFCLLQIGDWYVFLWKNADIFFVFDCFGRRVKDLLSDREKGLAMLVCLRSFDNVVHLLLNLSSVSPDQFFTIRQPQIKSLNPCGKLPTPEIVDRTNQFEVLSSDYALLRGTIHLGSACFKEIRYRQSLPVAIAALINAKIDATPTWDSRILDKIIQLGTQFFKNWTQCDFTLDLGLQGVPSRFTFGQYMIRISVNNIFECGQWICTPNYEESDLSLALRKSFKTASNILVQIQGRTYAMWKKKTFYYVLDPYIHHCSLEGRKFSTTTLHMCGSINKLCCIFTQALLELFEESTFLIHLVKVLRIEEEDYEKNIDENIQIPCMCGATPEMDISSEEVSLNESVQVMDGYECTADVLLAEEDSADLDSPGLSQIRVQDYSDLRKDFAEESEEETEDEDDDDLDLEDVGLDVPPDDDDKSDEDAPPKIPKSKKKEKKKPVKTDKKEKKERKEKKEKKEKPKDQRRKGNDKDGVGQDSKNNKIDEDEVTVEEKNEGDDKIGEKTPRNGHAERTNTPDKVPTRKASTENTERAKAASGKQPTPSKEQDRTDITEQSEDPITNKQKPSNDEQTKQTSTEVTSGGRPKQQVRKDQDKDASSLDYVPSRLPTTHTCKPNCYPGFTEDPQDLAVVGSENGNYESLCTLLKSSFRCTDRVLTMTPWRNYVAFRSNGLYLIFDGCTCDLRPIRHMDLSAGTAGLLCFPDLHALITYIEGGKEHPKITASKKDTVEQICRQYCCT